jgi:osmotically inducible protein OsmC
MERKADAVWTGGLKDGKGTISTTSGVLLNAAYSFGTRFENAVGTNPEELVAAAHAGCFSMALSGILGEAGFRPESIHTIAPPQCGDNHVRDPSGLERSRSNHTRAR